MVMAVDISRPTSIPGVAEYFRREAWVEPGYPCTGPRPTQHLVDTVPLHYTASPDVPGNDPGDTIAAVLRFLAAINRDYRRNRGYSIGYGFAVDGAGRVYELRGYDFKNAANLNWNHRTLPILVLVDGQDPMTPAQLRSVNALYAEHERRRAQGLNLVGHRDIGATACPGDGVYVQIVAGDVVPVAVPGTNPEFPAPPSFTDNLTGGQPMRALKNHDEIVDTRTSPYGEFQPGEPHKVGTLFGAHANDYADAEAIAVRVAAKSLGNGYISVWADGGDPGNVAVNFRPGEWETDLVFTGLDDGEFFVQVFGSPAHVVMAVQGVQMGES